MLDTKYWIDLKQNPDQRSRFKTAVSTDDVEVLFSIGNFIDLVKADEQDELSEIIASTVDTYIPSFDYEGREYRTTNNPIGLISDKEFRNHVRRQTIDFGEMKTLRFIFRVWDWKMEDTSFVEMTEQLKRINDEYGFENAQGLLFEEYLNDVNADGQYLLHEDEVDVSEYVRKMAALYRVSMMQENEAVDANDLADMEICSQAILTSCNVLLIESKWKNLQLVKKVTSKLEGGADVVVLDDFEEFFRLLDESIG